MSDYFDSILSDFGVEASDETHVYQLSKAELVGIVRGTVHATLVELGLKSHSLQTGRIYKKDMEKALGIRGFRKAVDSGLLKVQKDGNRTSPVYALREHWEFYIKKHVNQKV